MSDLLSGRPPGRGTSLLLSLVFQFVELIHMLILIRDGLANS